MGQEALSEVFGAVHHEVALEALFGGPAQHTMKKTGMNISENIEKNIENTLKKHGTYLKVTAHIGIVRKMAMDMENIGKPG